MVSKFKSENLSRVSQLRKWNSTILLSVISVAYVFMFEGVNRYSFNNAVVFVHVMFLEMSQTKFISLWSVMKILNFFKFPSFENYILATFNM